MICIAKSNGFNIVYYISILSLNFEVPVQLLFATIISFHQIYHNYNLEILIIGTWF